MKFKPLEVLKEYGGTKVTFGKDLDTGVYLVEKRVTTKDSFVKTLFENEKDVLKRLRHSNIIKFLGEGGDSLSFFIEYAPLKNLKNFLQSHKDFNGKRYFIKQIIDALIYIHDAGYAHNDINLTNILVINTNKCKLSDFAFAGKIGEPVFPDRPVGVCIGTSSYKTVDNEIHSVKNDIFAFGKVLYEILTNDFDNRNLKLIDFSNVNNDALKVVIEKCLNAEYNSIGETYAELRKATKNFVECC